MMGEIEHGTYKGASQHHRTGVPMCDECRAAQRDYMREYRKRPGHIKTKVYRSAREAAVQELIARYPSEYRRLYRAAKSDRPIPQPEVIVACAGCGEEFARTHGSQEYCTPKCRDRAWRARRRAS